MNAAPFGSVVEDKATRHSWAPEAERPRLDALDDAWRAAAEAFNAERSEANHQAYTAAVGAYHDACEAL